jgi:hypothetical protein
LDWEEVTSQFGEFQGVWEFQGLQAQGCQSMGFLSCLVLLGFLAVKGFLVVFQCSVSGLKAHSIIIQITILFKEGAIGILFY